jgi:hypothetical protein
MDAIRGVELTLGSTPPHVPFTRVRHPETCAVAQVSILK